MARFGAKIQIGAIPTSVYELCKTVFSLVSLSMHSHRHLVIKIPPKIADSNAYTVNVQQKNLLVDSPKLLGTLLLFPHEKSDMLLVEDLLLHKTVCKGSHGPYH